MPNLLKFKKTPNGYKGGDTIDEKKILTGLDEERIRQYKEAQDVRIAAMMEQEVKQPSSTEEYWNTIVDRVVPKKRSVEKKRVNPKKRKPAAETEDSDEPVPKKKKKTRAPVNNTEWLQSDEIAPAGGVPTTLGKVHVDFFEDKDEIVFPMFGSKLALMMTTCAIFTSGVFGVRARLTFGHDESERFCIQNLTTKELFFGSTLNMALTKLRKSVEEANGKKCGARSAPEVFKLGDTRVAILIWNDICSRFPDIEFPEKP